MIVLGRLGDSMRFEKPSALVVRRVVRGSDPLLRPYALGGSRLLDRSWAPSGAPASSHTHDPGDPGNLLRVQAVVTDVES